MDDLARFAVAGVGLLLAVAVVRASVEWLVAHLLARAVGLMCRSHGQVD